MITGQNVLLTGGAGSVGRSLIPRFLEQDPNVVRIFDNNEPALAEVKSQFDDDRCRFLAGDVRDGDRLERAMEDIDVVVHTAAMKHVDVCEYNPFEAVKTNALGLQNIVDAAIDSSVQRVVFTSSDKAVNPANTMGTTKLLGEKLVTAGNKHSGRQDLRLSSVRFGNVVNSSQSVIPIFADQIRTGGPVTLTDEAMTRFFLTYDDVFDLIAQTIDCMQGGEVFVYKMSAMRIVDLTEAMIETLAPQFGHDPAEIDVELIGRRPGETFHEEIMTDREVRRAYENDSMYSIIPETTKYLSYDYPDGFDEAENIVRSSEHAEKLTKAEIVDFLESGDANGELFTFDERTDVARPSENQGESTTAENGSGLDRTNLGGNR
ncbi:SDR family NAD(P)-dependent oxidoreductase [Halopiger xanaduensis]|uniref:Polysaccharide biosynthesis protein CapD n=1 Tax=Halopiger xanaduensis (strain DSM 18323 / JCM 14033 / SH-6) TaxID=797210 RepID=F8DAP9_HALXS|nr:SDR family NAD(P)-dependent oxidoreductase [Halopiger xanaduensis]AEH36991.1 polysaccharide biosynthesis protein CapD [Halopiger xanaduensis SH-6]